MNISINENYKHIKETYLFSEIASRVRKYTEQKPDARLIRLGIGDVTLPLPGVVVDAMNRAVSEMGVKETFRGYPPESGYPFLKEAVVRHYKDNRADIDVGEVFISDGAKSDIGNLVDILGNNEIIIPDPVYPVYVDSNLMNGNRITLITGNKENGFLAMPDQIASAGARVIYLCSPNNPTGAAYDHGQLRTWVEYALSTGSLIIYDSAYEAFVTDDIPHTIYEIEGADRCAIEVCSFSKFAGFTGTRCGWTVVPRKLLSSDGTSLNKMWLRRQSTKFNGVSYPVQRGAEAALSAEGIRQCMANIDYYRENASMLGDTLSGKGIYYTGGKNSPYIWLQCPMNMNSWDFFDMLLYDANIVGTPGEGFGKAGEGFFRITAFGTHESTAEACGRLKELL
ncbi:MAG: LL-diaminopimelate aminotransferase [Clostridiales bacterium]|nr:LL-diaminopimelate aminotransferase [Clostridiales bacterium]